MSFISVSPLTLLLGAAIMVLGSIILLVRLRAGKSPKKGTPLKTLPGPKGLPLLGSSHVVGRFKNPWDAFSGWRKQFGDIYGMTLGSRRCVVISNMSLIKEVLVAKGQEFANRPDFLRFHAIFRGDRNLSIALCDWSDKQKTRREMAFPFMHPRVATLDGNRMNNIIMYELQELVSALSKVQNQKLSARSYLLFTTANIFYQYICSKRFSDQDTNFLKLIQIYDLVFRELFKGFAIDFMPWLKVFNSSRLQELKDLAQNVSNVTEVVVKEHEVNIDHNKPRDLVDIYLSYLKDNEGKSESSLTYEDVEVIIEDLIGGHSVLGNLWLWGLYLLASNPKVRANIREEVTRVTGNMRAPSMEDRKNMPYTEATTFELLRVIASPIIPHVATTDTDINGYHVAKDTMVMFNTYDMNMDPKLWSEPRQFKPERFITSSGNVSKPDYFIPFGTGKRTCLGDGLVKSTLFLGLSTLIQNFDITLPEGFPEANLYEIPAIVVPNSDIFVVFRQLTQQETDHMTAISIA
ncbi:cytochrome P450 307a1 [Parasteatoda tepidariorum]|uniref:cytochrome P450 307a1 n=1 Tax=Parasteatoda tepidariorum TaxID=114398 RepID=UPI00077FCFE6|nr:cytochrome P450 307a1 [Parasteatoda tepidariorum]XP_015926869.1 cytochrome P450 307a1 [Parasteatoda tepidariorum]